MKRWEATPRRLAEDYADMTRDELIKLIIYQRERMEESDAARKESDRRISELTDKISELTELLRKSNEATSAMAVQMSGLLKQLGEKDRKIAELQSEVKAGRKDRFGRKSQKGTKGRGDANRPTPHTDVKDGFDGTSASLPAALDVDAEAAADTTHVSATSQKGSRLYRLGKTYRTMDADNCMLDIDHVCCMAHVRAKFKYAAEIEHDRYARRFLEYIGRLYALEKRYEEEKLSAEQVRHLRNSAETTGIIIEMRSLLDLMKSENAPRCGSLMEKAVSYLDHFWNRVFLYRKDGDYTIDNSLAERCIRPLANERKNSLFFGSDKMARVSAAYHSVVSTCKLQGYSILEYLKKFFEEIAAGNRDYGKLMPSTIGISANKL